MNVVLPSHTEFVISSTHLIPWPMGLAAFSDFRKHNVKVTTLTNSLASNDEPLVHTGYARYRSELLKSGVDLYELSPTRILRNKRLMFPGMSVSRLHAKTDVFDRSKDLFGSMHLTPRSATENN